MEPMTLERKEYLLKKWGAILNSQPITKEGLCKTIILEPQENIPFLNCQTCGACCSNPTDSVWIEVTDEDAIRINDASLIQEGDIEKYAMKQRLNGHCVALVGDVGNACKCSIYDKRPEICRIVQPRDTICLRLRSVHKLNK